MPIVKAQKRKKELQIINKTIDNKINKTGKTKSLADYPIWMYQSLWLKIISKVKLCSLQLLMNRKRQGKKDLANLVSPPSQNALCDLIENTWKMESASKKFFAQKNPAWK